MNHSSISPVAFTAQPIGNSATTLLVAMVLGIATFGGLNTVVPVAEETRNPKKNVPLALALLATILGLAIILNCYSQTISYGIADMFNYAGLSDPGIIIYAKFLGPAVAAVFAVFIVNSFNSSGVSFETAAVRTSYAFARDGILFPQWMARVNRHGAPGRMVIFNGALAAVIAIVSGIVLGPLTAGVFLIISNSIFSLSNHAIAGIGLTAYHRRKGGDLRALVHTVIPVLVAAAIAVAIFYTVYPAPPAPLNYSAWIAGIYLAAIVITYLAYRNRSTAIERVGGSSASDHHRNGNT
ncbi:APC family permease [Thermogymnomonas acidicola]|uniref:APC family permease n=1 Tax=Thermogymnomonas acidicola TaxID=399579 RepID=UPI0014946B1F|nr:APC family permease [Thermogymnomonas acidicola]